MKVLRLMALVAAVGIAGGSLARAADPAPGSTLEALDRDVQALHEQINSTLVRVSVTQSAAAVLDSVGLKADFEKWTPPVPSISTGGGIGGGGGRRGGEGRGGRPDPNGPGFGGGFGGRGPGGGGEPGGGVANKVRAFLADRINQLKASGTRKDLDEADKLRALSLRVDLNRGVFQGEMSAAVLDAQGHALLLTGLIREAHTPANPMHVTLPDGTLTNAAFVGANLYGNYTVVKLDNAKGTTPIKWSARKVAGGQLYMTTTAGPGNGALVFSASRPDETSDQRLFLPAEDRSGMFIHDIQGRLVAVMPSGGGLNSERYATTAPRMQREIDYIISEQRDIEPRSLGLDFVTQPATGSAPRSVLVKAVAPKSLAEAAKLMPGDILVSIDGQPISELVSGDNRETTGMVQLKVDLLTRTGTLPLVVKRGGAGGGTEVALNMPLK